MKGTYVVKYGGYSFSVMRMPQMDFGVTHRAGGNSITRLLDPNALPNGRHVVVDTARLANNDGFIYKKGQLPGEYVLVLQVSDKGDCGTVYTNDVG